MPVLPAGSLFGSASVALRTACFAFLAEDSKESLLLVCCCSFEASLACLCNKEGLIVRGCALGCELVGFEEDVSSSVGLVSPSDGRARVVTMCVISFEKNFSSL